MRQQVRHRFVERAGSREREQRDVKRKSGGKGVEQCQVKVAQGEIVAVMDLLVAVDVVRRGQDRERHRQSRG